MLNIRDYLSHGKENAIHLEELVKAMGCSDSAIKKLIREDRRSGKRPLICSGLEGYFLAKNESEEADFRRKYTHNSITTLTIARAIDRALECSLKGQEVLSWGDQSK